MTRRRGPRRADAPPTAGYSTEKSADEKAPQEKSAGQDGSVGSDDAKEQQKQQKPQKQRPRVMKQPSEQGEQLSARDRWILEQRPPHW